MRTIPFIRNIVVLTILALFVALAATLMINCDSNGSTSGQEGTPVATAQPPRQSTNGGSDSGDVSDLYEQTRPSVVRILTVGATSGVFGTTPTEGLGSGIVLDEDGNILTNYHVVADAQQLQVTLSDDTTADAEVIGTDPLSDLAVILADIPSDQLEPATLGDSDDIRVGESVIAIGNPFGLEGTVTEGIISGVDRTLAQSGQRPIRQLIQTDAAINPGNSGGPLVNFSGEVIGINTAIENPSGSGTFVGVGYAIPINTAKQVLDQMLAGETITHARLGIAGRTLTPGLAESLNIDVESGVYVAEVDPNSAAGRAGVQGAEGDANGTLEVPPGGDVITAIDDQETDTFEELADYVDTKQPGDTVTLHIVRNGEEITLDATLDAWELPSS